jgi:hypothetical protein
MMRVNIELKHNSCSYKISIRVPYTNDRRLQWCYSHVAAVKFPEDRKPCLTPTATEKNPASMFIKKGDDLRSTHKFTWWVMESEATVDLWLPCTFVRVAHTVWHPWSRRWSWTHSSKQERNFRSLQRSRTKTQSSPCHKILGTPWEWGPRIPIIILL